MQLGLSARGVGAAALLRQVAAKEGAQALMAGVAPRIVKRTLQVNTHRISACPALPAGLLQRLSCTFSDAECRVSRHGSVTSIM